MVIVTKKTTTCLLSIQTLTLLHVREKTKQNQEDSAMAFCSAGPENPINLPHSEDVLFSLRLFISSFSHSKLYFFLQRNKSILYGHILCNTFIDGLCRIIIERLFFLCWHRTKLQLSPRLNTVFWRDKFLQNPFPSPDCYRRISLKHLWY